MNRFRIVQALVLAVASSATSMAPSRGDEDVEPPATEPIVTHLESLVPMLLERTGTPGCAIALIEEGSVAYQKGFGYSDLTGEIKMSPDNVFNVGSISKTVSAWGVMRLVDEGKLDLDRPVTVYLPGLFRQADTFDPEQITARRLLSHTAGLSMSAVPEYHPRDTRPDLWSAVTDSVNGVRLVHEPGAAWKYSGGGYMVLQLLVERLTGQSFADYMRNAVLRPLGMASSSFEWSEGLLAAASKGYDADQAETPYYRYVGQAAASLNSTVGDLSRFLIASLATRDSVLHSASVRLLQAPAPNAVQRFGLRYGLGYDIWNLAEDKPLVGHNGQNTGWAAAAWVSPLDQSGIVILTNHSDGMDVWRWILCDWAQWRAGTVWRGLCTERPDFLSEPVGFWQDSREH